MHETKKELVKLLAKECSSLDEIQDLLKSLFKGTIEEMLEAEIDEHLGYEKHSSEGDNSGNSRNGYNKKPSVAKWVKQRLAYQEIAMAALNQNLLVNIRPRLGI